MDVVGDYSFELLKESVSLYSCSNYCREVFLGRCLPIFWSSEFISFTQHEKEISIFVSSKFDDYFKNLPVTKMEDEYRVLKVYQTNHGIEELGIVAQFAKIFMDMEIPILYVNSFSNNYILLPASHLEKLEGMIEF